MKLVRLIALGCALFLLSGAPAPWVPEVSGAVTVQDAALRAMVEQHIRERTPWKGCDMRFDYPGEIRKVVLPGDRFSCRVTSMPSQPYIGSSIFFIRFYEKEVLVEERRVRLTIEVLVDVVVSSRNLERDREIREEDVAIVKKWFRKPPRNLLSRTADVVGKKLTAAVGPSREIRGNMLRESYAVKRGAPVRILVDEGPIHLSTTGICQENGSEGSIVRVQNASSRKVIYALVIGDSLVKVDY